MTRLLNALVLLGMAGSFVAGQAYDQEKQNKDATCDVSSNSDAYQSRI